MMYDSMFDKDLQTYVDKPLKELLKGLNGKLRINYRMCNGVDFYGTLGGTMQINQIPWYLADYRIKYVKSVEDTRYYDIVIVLMEENNSGI